MGAKTIWYNRGTSQCQFVAFFLHNNKEAPLTASAKLKRTPLYDRHVALGARVVEFGGWEMPVQYSGIVDEHNAVRNAAGLFDISHMGEFEVKGRDALAFLQHVAT